MTAAATIALGLVPTLDVATARRLYGYDDLDDAGVAAALEQTGRQPGGGPDYLRRVQYVAAVIDSDDDITLAAFEAASFDEEYTVLTTLFALFPDTAGQAVSWDAGAWQLLLRRAYMHELQAPAAVHAWPRRDLCQLFDDRAPGPGDDVQADALRLFGKRSAVMETVNPALRVAIGWYDMDLRWRCVSGEIDAETHRQRMARVIARCDGGQAVARREEHF